jgi:hypothetical protein
MRPAFASLLAVVVLGLGGCSAGGPEVKEVTGKVTLDGKSLADADVRFWPKDDPELGSFGDRTGSDGTFTIKLDSGYKQTVKAGKFVVTISKLVKKDGTLPKSREEEDMMRHAPGALREVVPERYLDRKRQLLVVDIQKGTTECPPFELTSKSNR